MAPAFRGRRATVGLVAATVALAHGAACSSAPRTERAPDANGFAGQRVGACSSGRTVDSAYVVRAAAQAIARTERAGMLLPHTYEAVISPGPIEEGVLVRLLVPGQVGGGGLAFVDIESGCAIALKLYE